MKEEKLKESTARLREENKRWADIAEAERTAKDNGFDFEDVTIGGDGMQDSWDAEMIPFLEGDGTIADSSGGNTTSDANVMDGVVRPADWVDGTDGVIRIDIGENGLLDRIDAIRCPSCGWSMSVRTAKKGKRSGQKFLGCQQYPVCMTTYNMGTDADNGRMMILTPNYRPADTGLGVKVADAPKAQKVGIGTKRRRKIEL